MSVVVAMFSELSLINPYFDEYNDISNINIGDNFVIGVLFGIGEVIIIELIRASEFRYFFGNFTLPRVNLIGNLIRNVNTDYQHGYA